MSFLMFAITGLCVGLLLYDIARDRFAIGLPGALLLGVVATFVGGVLGNLIAGAPLGAIRVSSAGGTAIGGLSAIALMAILAHRRHRLHPEREQRPMHLARTVRGWGERMLTRR